MLMLIATLPAQDIHRIDGTTISHTELTQRLSDLQADANVHGLSVTILNGEGVIFERALGSRNLDEQAPLSNTDVFYAASLAKPLFAYLVLRLVEEGTIDLDKPLVDYLDDPLPSYPFPESYEGFADLKDDLRYEKITARMCLSHTTGFPNWRYIGKTGINLNKPLTIEYDPGTYYYYSGEGLQLLQFVVEQVTGEDLEELARRHVFQPLGMEMTSFVWQNRFEGNYAVGHYRKKKVVGKKKRNRPYAAGSMETTPEDYAKFVGAMLRAEGLSEAMYAEMTGPQIAITSVQQFGPNSRKTTDANEKIGLSYGLGWGIYETGHGKAVFKEGHDRGWEHYTIFYPDRDLALLIMTNSSNGESIFKELVEAATGDTALPWYWENYLP